MVVNIICGLVLGSTVGLVIFWLLDVFVFKQRGWKEITISVTIMLACVIASTAFMVHAANLENRNFNDGYCIQCGIKYEALTHYYGATYYECPNCYFGTHRY